MTQNAEILKALDGPAGFTVSQLQRKTHWGYNRACHKVQELIALGLIAEQSEGRYAVTPPPAPPAPRPHLHTADVDIWTATYGAPLQIGQWLRVKPGVEFADEFPGGYMVTALALDIRSGALTVSAINDRGLALTNWIIQDLEPATHGR